MDITYLRMAIHRIIERGFKKRFWITWLLWGIVALLCVRFVLFIPEAARRPSHGFVAYYTASRLLAEGADASQFYDVEWFKSQINRFQPEASDVHINPPATNLLLLPLVNLDYTGARILWTAFNLFCLGGILIMLIRELQLKGIFVPLFLCAVLWFQPIYANFHLGQAYVLLLGLLVVAWYGYRRERDVLSGVPLGLMLIFKLAGVFIWLLLLIQRKWRALGWGTAVSLLIFLLSLPWLGVPAWVRYLALLRGFTSQPERGVTAYQTVSSFFSHLFIYEAHWNPEPLITAGWLGEGLIWLVTAILLIVSCVWVGKTVLPHRFTRDLHFAIFTILSVILSPLALDYHYPLLLLPIGVVLAWIIRSWTTGNRWSVVIFGLWAMAVFAIGADLPYRSPRLTVGIWALLAYPKLYGALLLWVIAMWAVNDDLKREHAQQ